MQQNPYLVLAYVCQCLYSTPNCLHVCSYLKLIRCLCLPMFGFGAKLLHICGKILIWCLFDAYSVFLGQMVRFGRKLLHICSKMLIWCLFDAYSMLISASCFHLKPNCCMYAANSSFGAYLKLIRCLFLPMFVFNTKLLHICIRMLIWCLFEAYSMLMFANVCIWRQIAAFIPHTNVCVRGQFEGVSSPKSIWLIIVELKSLRIWPGGQSRQNPTKQLQEANSVSSSITLNKAYLSTPRPRCRKSPGQSIIEANKI